MQKIAELEQEIVSYHSNTALMQERLDTLRSTSEEHITEKKKVLI